MATCPHEPTVLSDAEKKAYRNLLYWGMLDIRMLCQSRGRESCSPIEIWKQYRRSRLAGALADWLHNLAEQAATDFNSFDTERFWREYDGLRRRYSEASYGQWMDYRARYEEHLSKNASDLTSDCNEPRDDGSIGIRHHRRGFVDAFALGKSHAMTNQSAENVDVEFIRLLFRSRVEEEIAHRWASRLGRILGPRVIELRPCTTLSELLVWAATSGVDSMDFALVFEPELRLEFAEFLDCPEHVTFRELVEHYASRFKNCA
jgi:hypothetical protein